MVSIAKTRVFGAYAALYRTNPVFALQKHLLLLQSVNLDFKANTKYKNGRQNNNRYRTLQRLRLMCGSVSEGLHRHL